MADDDTQTQTAPPPALPAGMTADQVNQVIQQYGLAPQMPQRDTTPVKRSFTSLLGEALGGGQPVAGMTPAEQEAAGNRALMNAGIGLMAASRYQPGQTVFSNLAQAFQGAQRSEIGSAAQAMNYLGAQQDWALKQQAAHLEALKTALPFLQLGYRQSLPSPFAGNAPSGGGAAPGGGISGNTYESAINTHEGAGKDPNSSAVGGFLSGTWNDFAAANPDLFKGMSPDQILAARSNSALRDQATTWLAQQNAKLLTDAGVTPSGQSLGISHYIGAGPAAKVMAAPDNAPVAGFVSDAAVKANPELGKMTVGQLKQRYAGVPNPGFLAPPGQPAPYKVATAGPIPPPPSGGSTASASGPPSTGVVSPGELPGAGTPASTTTPPPASTATLNTPEQSRAIAIAQAKDSGREVPIINGNGLVAKPDGTVGNPSGTSTTTPPAMPAPQQTTQATQPPTPPAVTTPPAQPPIDLKSAPDTTLSLEDFTRKHWTPLTPDEVDKYAPGPDNQLARDRAAQVQTAQNNADAARTTLLRIQAGQVPGDINKAMAQVTENNAQLAAAEKNYDDAVRSLTTEGAKNLATIDNQQKDRLAAQYKASVTDPANAAALAKQQGDQAIALERAKGSTASEEKVMQGLDETFDTAKSAIDQINLTRTLSQASGDPTFIQQLQKTHPDLVRWMANLGGLDDDTVQRLGTAGAMDAAMNKLISMARTGSGFQRMTNLDVQILSSQAPGGTDPQAWREAKLAYLQTYLERQMQYVTAVHELRADGMPLQKARVQAQQQAGSVVPTVPNFTDQPGGMTASQQRIKWAADKGVQPGTFVIAPDGQLVIAGQPQRQQQPQPQRQPSLVPVN